MLTSYLVPLLLFIPGPLLLYLVFRKRGNKPSRLETLVLGSTIWTYFLVSGSTIVGVITLWMREFFLLFTIFSIGLIAYGGYCLLNEKRELKIKIDSNKIFLLIFFLLPFGLIVTLGMIHTVLIEYDAIFTYLPMAKSIVETGGLQYDILHLTSLTTSLSPLMPVLYAFVGFFSTDPVDFELAVRLVPLVYVLLTAILVYLICREISLDPILSAIASISFLFMPVVFATSGAFLLYLDIPFTFLLFLSMFILLKIHNNREGGAFWWLMLGMTMCLMLLEKDLSYFVAPAILALAMVPIVLRFAKRIRVLAILLLSLMYTGAYSFFFFWDATHSAGYMLVGIVIRQIPSLVVGVIFLLLMFKLPKQNDYLFKTQYVAILFMSLIPFALFLVRNIIIMGAISYGFPVFNAEALNAATLMQQATGLAKVLPQNLFDVLRWDILFTSFNLGATFFVPILLGLATTIWGAVSNGTGQKRYFLQLSFLLMLLSMWSWVFGCSYQDSELRRLYYFAPLFAIFAAMGVGAFTNRIRTRRTVVTGFIVYVSLLYLLNSPLILNSLNYIQILSSFLLAGVANINMLAGFAFVFLVSFSLAKLINPSSKADKYRNSFATYTQKAITLGLIAILISSALPLGASLSNIRSSDRQTLPSWESDLDEVISYINQNLHDNSAIITCYALPIAYFTNHPVIEVVRVEGVMILVSLNNSWSSIMNTLIDRNIRYLLYPKPEHSLYSYFVNLSRTLLVLDINALNRTHQVMLLEEFSRYYLYSVVP